PGIEKTISTTVKTLLERVALHGTLDLDYVYNVADPPGITDVNRLRLNDPDSNSFEVGWARLAVLRETTTANEWDAGFHLAFAAGREVVNTLSLDPHFLFQQPFNVAQAYVDLQMPTPVGNPLLIRAGRFYGWFGVESLDTALNPNFSLSWFTRFTPFTTTGFGAGMNLGAGFRYMQYLVNGWDLVIDDNAGKTVGGQLSWQHTDPDTKTADYTVAFNWIWGPELPNDTRRDRTQVELAASAHPFPGTTFLAVADFGEGAVSTTTLPASFSRLTGKFGGVMLIARQELGEVSKDFYRFAVAGRVEVWRDEGGLNAGLDETLLDTTGTFEVHFTEFARLRFEVRRDQSSRDHFFIGHRGLPSSDQMVTVSVDAALSF
ncbi:MAG TPA: outer membrane beta-barrel protein, partial [Planctomycetota bacterium]|nr:outer membrane beta-barrel protein [Planctomycetota bacterium]